LKHSRFTDTHGAGAAADTCLAALQAAAKGWRVGPMRQKRPAFARWAELFTTHPATIELWFGDVYRDAGLGAIPPAHIVRIDVDHHATADGWDTINRWSAARFELPETLAVRTPRAGLHLYFTTGAEDLTSAFVGPSVELKVGLTVLPPTRGYRWLGFGDERIAELPEWFAVGARRAVQSNRVERAKAASGLAATSLDELAWMIEAKTGDAPRRPRDGWLAFRCPAHNDRSPSAWAKETDRGVRVGCSAGCPPASVTQALEAAR
jgi:hypothetical protein